MFKSLYSGVSGLGANLTNLDVIGNNIANSNTVGFKSGRVTFNEMLTQTIKSASRPVAGGLGGTNPQQVGLGTQVGSIDTNFNQGNFQTTGKSTDLAIQGAGFFILNNGESNVYTRAGIFGLDSENTLVNPSTGMRVQGVMANDEGILPSGPMTDIVIDPSLVVPASPSSTVSLMGNLDSNSDAKATIMESPAFLAAASGSDLLTEMSGETSGLMNLRIGNVISINGHEAGVATELTEETFTVVADSNYDDLVSWLNSTMTNEGRNVTFNIGTDGDLVMTNNDADIEAFALNVPSNSNFNTNFSFPDTVGTGETASSGQSRAYAESTDLLSDLYSSTGEALGIDFSAATPTLVIGGDVGGETVTDSNVEVSATSTLGDLMQEIQFALGISSNPVVLNEMGQMTVTGEVGTDSAIGEISISELGVDNSTLEDAFDYAETQEAVDQSTYSMSTTVYDSLGGEHTVSFLFEKNAGMNEWTWTANTEGEETITSGNTGTISFDEEGAVTNFSYDDGSTGFTFDPNASTQGAASVTLTIDYGEIGGLTGLTQFEGSGNLQSIADGFGTGTLVDFNIDQSGIITGVFSNDTMRSIAQIGMATFSNADGLTREANNTYRRSGNSGQAVESFAGSNGVTLVPGALETSNVDLAKEFTNLVVAQRAFQANSRVITTADQVMQELVNLVR